MGMTKRTALIRTKQSSCNSKRAFHPASRHSTFSITGCQSYIETCLATCGIPRYLMRRDSHGVARIVEHHATSSSGIPKATSVDLSQLRLRPKKSEKLFNIVDTFSATFVVPSSRNIMLSAYWMSRIPCCRLVVYKPCRSSPLQSC